MYRSQLERFIRTADAGSFNKAAARAKAAMQDETSVVRIGTSPMTPAQLLTDLWPQIHQHCSDVSFQLVPFENTPENAREILNMDAVRDKVLEEHLPVNLVDFDFYDVDIFNQCERQKNVLLAIEKWSCVHPMLKVIPVEWEYAIPFGILYPPQPSEMLERFLEAVRQVVSAG
ncbi:MAG: hypothetical protein NC302_09520 [Bacteroidales bacterium]|nr:hypothetical protein [Bacteroidales bacterium]MCM1415369.1 hypothetical protein [bacterium]MCM1423302.1 hypothetical protein [bacterium]